jgi:hypothetical protein
VSAQLNAEGVPAPERLGPKGIAKCQRDGLPIPQPTWCPSGVREVLTRELYKGIVVEGRVKRGKGRGGRAIRIRVPESEWKRRPDETLLVVSDDQWNAAHAQMAATSAKYLRQGNRLVGKAESLNGRYLLSAGLIICGATAPDGTICGATLHAVRRGRNPILLYVCQAHRERGASVCGNVTGVPAHELHVAVIASLRETFSAETFEAHLKKSAEDESARASRAAERAIILDRLPILASRRSVWPKRWRPATARSTRSWPP